MEVRSYWIKGYHGSDEVFAVTLCDEHGQGALAKARSEGFECVPVIEYEQGTCQVCSPDAAEHPRVEIGRYKVLLEGLTTEAAPVSEGNGAK